MSNMKILVVDNDQYVLDSYRMLFEGENIELIMTGNGTYAINLVKQAPHSFDLVIVDYDLPDNLMGDVVTKEIKAIAPRLPIIIVSGLLGRGTDFDSTQVKSIETICRAAGADRLIAKGHGISEILTFVLELNREKKEPIVSESDRHKKIKEILKIEGVSQSLYSIALDVERFAPLNHTVLIRGETGVGKECIARAIHSNSHRKNGNFVAVNCASVPKELAESEFFGHEKGAFTGAINKKTGKFLQAHGGSIFLDEIGDMPFDLQSKFLRVLQERTIEPVGSNQSIKVDLRIVAATHQNLEQAIDQSRFRQDLFYRLRELIILIPPLRERPEDIEPIALSHISALNNKYSSNKSINDRALKKLKAHFWPGNVRELHAILSSAHAMTDRVIHASALESALEESSRQTVDSARKMGKIVLHEELSRRHLLEEKLNLINALKVSRNNKEVAAKLLGFKHSSQMKYRMKATGLNPNFRWGGENLKTQSKLNFNNEKET